MGYAFRSLAAGVTAALCLSLSGGVTAHAADLGIGDPAPAITVAKYVKGTPVTQLGGGKISVVEFWATWCGPCKMSIPHLTELAKKYPDVQFVGVSVWERDQSLVEPFVTQMGDKMAYTVAMDSIPTGEKLGVMAKTWMTAAGQNGIPTAFVIGKDGKIAWIGHPMAMAEPLAKITAGTWDLDAARTEFAAAQARQAKMAALSLAYAKAKKSGDPKQVVAVLDKAFADDPKLEDQLCTLKFAALRESGDVDQTLAYGDHLLQAYSSNSMLLNGLAWSIVAPKPSAAAAAAPAAETKLDPRIAAFALKAAQKADEAAQQKDPSIADTLAAAFYATGNATDALKTEQRALDLAKGTSMENNAGLIANRDKYSKATTAAN